LLLRAERRVAAQWETSARIEQLPEAAENLEAAAPAPEPETQPRAEAVEPVAAPAAVLAPEAADAGGLLDIFSQFPCLEAAPTPKSRLACLTDTESLAAESFRLLGVRLRHLRRDRPLKKVLITSTIPQEGKSMVAGNLACSLALRTHLRTLLLEGDLRRSSLYQKFGLGRNPGLSEYLAGERTLAESVYRIEGAGLWFLPAGSAPSNALELLQSGRLAALMEQLAAWFDWIVIDSPPILPLADTSVWARLSDGILLVTRQGITQKSRLQRGLEAIEPRKLIGALLNGSSNAAHSDYYYRSPSASQPGDTSER
jgi:capsular exopolysaccharide synthesis family protein